MSKPRVIVVDDSAVMRKLLEMGIEQSGACEVVATAADPYEAWEKIKEHSPDAITLDVQMPRMNGIVFLERLMHQHPIPVVMVSSVTQEGCEATLRALELGAADFVTKPARGSETSTAALVDEVVAKLRRAVSQAPDPVPDGQSRSFRQARTVSASHLNLHPTGLVIGGNSGGVEALRRLVKELPRLCPPVLVSHYLPSPMQKVMIAQLQRQCSVDVREAKAGDEVCKGTVYFAPAEVHMVIKPKDVSRAVIELQSTERVNGCRPSVDVLFASCGKVWANRTMAVLLDGIGVDGRAGLRDLAGIGATAIFQCESLADTDTWASAGSSPSNPRSSGIQRMLLRDVSKVLAALTLS